MAFYSSKCEKCTESSKRVLKKVKCRDENGTYYVKYYQCENLSCNIVSNAQRAEKKIKYSGKRRK